jgi:hypothetical protein
MSLEATSPELFTNTAARYPWSLLMVHASVGECSPSSHLYLILFYRYQTNALVAMVSHYGWQRVAVLSTLYQYGSEGHALLEEKLTL